MALKDPDSVQSDRLELRIPRAPEQNRSGVHRWCDIGRLKNNRRASHVLVFEVLRF